MPYAQPARATPFGGNPFGMQGSPYGAMPMAAPAFPGGWGAPAVQAPVQPVNPYMLFMASPAQANARQVGTPPANAQAAQPFNAADWLKLLSPQAQQAAPAPQPAAPAPTSVPFTNPWVATAPAPAAQAVASAPAQPTAPAQPATVKPAGAPSAVPTSPFDPAYWLPPVMPTAPAK
jgi:hypothetical protein